MGAGKAGRGDQVAARSSAESAACTAFSALIQAMLTRKTIYLNQLLTRKACLAAIPFIRPT